MSFLFEFLVRLAGLLQPLIIASFHLLVFFTGKYCGVVWCGVVWCGVDGDVGLFVTNLKT